MVNQELFNTFPIIETDRFLLRELEESDIPKLVELQSNTKVNQFLTYRNHIEVNKEEAVRFIATKKMFFEKKWGITWVFAAKETKEFLGIISYEAIDMPHHRAEISGELHPDYWRGRMAQEGLISVVRFGFENLNLHSIAAKTSPKNRATIAVLKRIGFQQEGHLVDRIFNGTTYEDQYLFSIIKGNGYFENLIIEKKHLLKQTI